MNDGIAELTEISLNRKSAKNAGRIRCAPNLIPAPGQYLLARMERETDTPLAVPIFSAGLCAGGFTPAHPLPPSWLPGAQLNIRGPFGKGFKLPPTARFVALAAFGQNTTRLLGLMENALAQNAATVLLTGTPPDDLSAAVEISPLSALSEITRWADYIAIDAPRSVLSPLTASLARSGYRNDGQILVETSIPCGGLGECAVCAVHLRKGFKLACKDGPVFDIQQLLE
jgi:dihydroorotate dehydrogenase electron transfer subunit